MSMRIDVDFERPLDGRQRVACSLAVATLVKGQRLRFINGDSTVVIYGEAMSAMKVHETLSSYDLPVTDVRTSLPSEEDREVDELDVGTNKERFKPIGR